MKDAWCLVTSDRDGAPRLLVQSYAKRRGIETSFRDLEDPRHRLGLSEPAYLTNLLLRTRICSL